MQVPNLEGGIIELQQGQYPFYTIQEPPERLDDQPRLMIHPYLQEGRCGYVNNSDNPCYEEKRDELVREHLGLITIAVGAQHLIQPINWLNRMQPKGPRLVYISDDANPFSLTLTKKFFAHRLRKVLGTDSLTICGAELVYKGYELKRDMGCVNTMYFFLKDYFDITLDREHSWVIQEEKQAFLPGMQV